MNIKLHDRQPIDIVRYILFKYTFDGEPITNLKMQKILYFVYVWNLILNEERCLDEQFQAWPIGPVLRSVYDELKKFRLYPIDPELIQAKGENMNEVVANFRKELGNDLVGIIDEIYEKYGQHTAFQLVTMTHNDTAWQKARKGLGPTDCSNNKILDSDIIKFYSGKIKNGKEK